MEVTKKIVEVAPAVPAVTEEVVVLELSIHEARVLRALYGKLIGNSDAINFLSKLNALFPGDFEMDYADIRRVEIEER